MNKSSKNVKRIIFDSKDDWKEFRSKYFTSSKINSLMDLVKREMNENELLARVSTKAKTIIDPLILSDGAITYILKTISNTESTPHFPDFYNMKMERGNEIESQAVLRFCKDYDYSINGDNMIYTSIGGYVFFYDEELNRGGTPDILLINDKKDVEIKCPDASTHLYYKLYLTHLNFQRELPIYYDQMQHNMSLTGATKTIFMSFDPNFKKEADQAFYLEISANETRQNEILNKIRLSNNLRNELLIKLNNGI